jgi:hypothetical protein
LHRIETSTQNKGQKSKITNQGTKQFSILFG